ncbi:ewing's tumor-associated antigen 1 isoform X2 [Antennarius striatus]|uniref:ewing's tumor-associated antigen 1 isoform X2 n=1 Tax=Antennarius striatus TaxID=241820 RepID=UPI0035B28473
MSLLWRTLSEPAANKPEFTDLWRNVSKLCDSRTQDRKTEKQLSFSSRSPVGKDLQSPKSRGWSRYPGGNNADSPGDVEPSQDIFWDPTSPTGHKNTRVVEISDIVNRIAPKDVKRRGSESPLLQWIGDSAVPSTPDDLRPKARKKSSRKSSVDDLVMLARQFDRNMQQDNETSEEPHTDSNSLSECGNTAETPFPGNLRDSKCASSSDQAEAELNALFDSSTQSVSGRLSVASSASAPSQEVRNRPVTSNVVHSQQSTLESAAGPFDPAAHPDRDDEFSSSNANHVDDFDDDWENDDLLNDSFVLALTQNPDQKRDTAPKTSSQVNAKTNATRVTSDCTSLTAPQSSDSHSKPSCSTQQELCSKRKTTTRSTFKLEPIPHIQPKAAAKKPSDSSFTVIQPKLESHEQKSATSKTSPAPQPDKIGDGPKETTCVAADAVKHISDSLWDDGNDDALLYQVCDSVERISNTQPLLGCHDNCQEKQETAGDTQRGASPRPMDAGARARRQSPCAFVLSNSLPGAGCETVNYQGWNIPMNGANNNSRLSQSFPGSHMSLGTFNQHRDSSGNAIAEVKPLTVAARGTQKSCHRTFKRNVCESAVINNKVFVTSQTTGQCSAAEIERKKQEALARRRQRCRMSQNRL